MASPLISGIRTAEDFIRADLERKLREEENPVPRPSPLPAPLPGTVHTASLADYVMLPNISCIDADGQEFEHYDQLLVRKDIFRNQQRQQQNFTPYNAAVYCEQQGLFLPSFALSCNILAALYQNRTNPDAHHLLLQYKDHGAGYGYQAQNTLVNYGTEQILHYPSAADFGQVQAVNSQRQHVANGFSKKTLEDSLLENALRDPTALRYVQQLTGLRNPSVLVEVGKYFGKPAKLWFPWSGKNGKNFKETGACWLGCSDYYFGLSSNSDLYDNDAARGVRLSSAPAGGAP